MGKKVFSLCMALALLVGLLPVTALAAAEGAPNSLYVGNQQVISSSDITYWTTDESTGGLTKYEGNNDNWNVKYEPSTATLTLKNATIKTTHSNVKSAVIYAESRSSSAVSLTIELKGTNTIKCASAFYGIYVNAEMSNDSYGTDASLTITGKGSLDVSGSSYGIWVKSGSGNASLTIENASVVANTTSQYDHGVVVQSSIFSQSSPALSLAVNGGSLTASGTGSSDGIQFYVGSSQATGATTSLTVSENAIVDARNGGISATGVNITPKLNIGSTGSTGGIVWNGAEGTVYGKVELQKDLEIKSGETLTVPDGSSLNCNGNLTNNGTINVESGGTVTGSLSGGSEVTTPSISQHPTGQTVTEGTQATFSVTANDAQSYQWQQSTDSGSNWTDISGATSASYTINSTTISMSGYQYRCVVKSASGVSVISQAATLTVNQSVSPTSYSISAYVAPAGAGTVTVNGSGTSATVTANSEVALAATANDGYRFTGWMENDRQVSTDATYTFKATGDRTLTAKFEKKVTGVTLNTETLELFTGGSATLTATVEPSDAANQNVTWQSDNANVATVEGGTVTAVGVGETTIRVTTEEGNYTATCKVTVTQSTYSISADTTALNFGSVYTGYAQPAARTVTITNTGNQTQPLTLTASTGSFEVGTLTKTQLAAGEKATFTVQPKAGLAVGTYSENITVSGTGGATVTITASFTVKQYSSGGSSSSTPSVSDQAIDKIEAAKDGATVEITLRTGQTKLDKEVFEELAGRDVTLEISLSNGVTWSVNGQDIPENADLTDLDMGVSLNTSTIPVNLINSVTGEAGTVQLTLKHNGEFGFTMTLTAPVGVKNAGLWANLYHYDEDAGKMVYQTAALVDKDGNVALPFDHASQYALVLDSKSHDLPFTDLAANAWYTDAVAYVYLHDIMEGMSATTFQPNGTLSRAQAVQIFYNLEGQPDISGENLGYPYEDVNAQAWYGDAVYWARLTGVATGYGDGTFQPTDSITRQEFAQMLYNYAKYKGYDLTAEGDLTAFPDGDSVQPWAETAMSWANGNELINGHDDGTIDAAGIGTRAQAASILMRFDQNLVEK